MGSILIYNHAEAKVENQMVFLGILYLYFMQQWFYSLCYVLLAICPEIANGNKNLK